MEERAAVDGSVSALVHKPCYCCRISSCSGDSLQKNHDYVSTAESCSQAEEGAGSLVHCCSAVESFCIVCTVVMLQCCMLNDQNSSATLAQGHGRG